MGGYCAFYYGGAINSRIIAFSPRNSAHPCIGHPKFSQLRFTHLEVKEVARSRHTPLVIMDPNVPEDLKFYTECIEPAYPGTKVVEVHFGGHRVAEALKESGQLSQFIYNYIEGGVL